MAAEELLPRKHVPHLKTQAPIAACGACKSNVARPSEFEKTLTYAHLCKIS